MCQKRGTSLTEFAGKLEIPSIRSCAFRHQNSDRRADKSDYFTEQNCFLLRSYFSHLGHFSLCVIVEFQPAGAARFRAGITFVIWLNPICPARRTCVKCAITAAAAVKRKHRSGLPRETALRFRRHGMAQFDRSDFRLSGAKIICKVITRSQWNFVIHLLLASPYDFPCRCNIIS